MFYVIATRDEHGSAQIKRNGSRGVVQALELKEIKRRSLDVLWFHGAVVLFHMSSVRYNVKYFYFHLATVRFLWKCELPAIKIFVRLF